MNRSKRLLSLLNNQKEGGILESLLQGLNFLTLPLTTFSFFLIEREVTDLIYKDGDEFFCYHLLKEKNKTPLRVKYDEEFSFTISYGTPFLLPRSFYSFPKIFLVYVVERGKLEKAKKDLKEFNEKLGPESTFVIILPIEENIEPLSLLEIHSKGKVVFWQGKPEYYSLKEVWKLGKTNPKSLIFYVGTELARDEKIEREIFSTLLDRKWLTVFNHFPSMNKLTWKGSKEGYAWYNVYWVKASYLSKLKEPKDRKCNFYYTKWLAEKSSPGKTNYDTLQTSSEKCNLGEYYFN